MPLSCRDLSLLLLCSLAAVAGASTFRQDNQRSGNAGVSLAVPLARERTLDIGAATISSPVVVNDTLYIGGRDSCVHAFAGGVEIWKRNTHGWVDATPAYAAGHVFVVSRSGLAYELDARNGDSLNAFMGSTPISSPAVFGNQVVFGRGESNLEVKAFSLLSGQSTWYTINSQPVFSSPAVKDSAVLYGDDGGILWSVNGFTGIPNWSFRTGGGVYLSSPAIDKDKVFFSPGDYDKNVYAVGLTSGGLLWKNAGSLEAGAVPLAKEVVFRALGRSPDQQKQYMDRLGRLGKISTGNLSALASLLAGKSGASSFVAAGGSATSSPAVGDSFVFVTRMEYGYDFQHRYSLVAFDKQTGAERWVFSEVRRVPEPLGFCSSPLVAGSTVFAGWGDGKLFALNARTGYMVWQDSLPGGIYSSPAVCNGRLYVATSLGKIFALRQDPSGTDNFAQGTYCYPNPARGSVSTIRVAADRQATAKVVLFNSADKPVLTFSGPVQPGQPFVYSWQIDHVANGVYFAHVQASYASGGKESKIIKIAVLH